jgi:hypothetical protein
MCIWLAFHGVKSSENLLTREGEQMKGTRIDVVDVQCEHNMPVCHSCLPQSTNVGAGSSLTRLGVQTVGLGEGLVDGR